MKNKIIKIVILMLLVFPLSACTTDNPIEENQFNVKFKEMDFKQNTASFVISGYPNEAEQKQIKQVVKDSLKNQKVEEPTKVSLYSDIQNEKDEPFYGVIDYKDQKIEGNINMPTEEEYIEIASI